MKIIATNVGLGIVVALALIFLLACFVLIDSNKVEHYDVVVFGGTPSGVSAALAAAKKGRSVVVLTQHPTIGGAISNGLGATDIVGVTQVTGFARKFFNDVKNYYGNSFLWRVEPSVAESIFVSYLNEAGVKIVYNIELQSVRKKGRKIACINIDQSKICGGNFIDASYEADLAHAAGANVNLGYSDFYDYEELFSQDREIRKIALFDGDADALENAFRNNPYYRVVDSKPYYKDNYISGMPSMTFRLCVTDVELNKIGFHKSDKYSQHIESWKPLFKSYFNERNSSSKITKIGTILNEVFRIAKLRNGKWDLNSGFASFMNIPIPEEYFESSEKRKEVINDFRVYMNDFLYFVQTDSSVPIEIQNHFKPFGYCADEFVDNDNFPYHPYVREGRRIIGRDTLTLNNVYINREAKESIGVGSYHLDGKPSLFLIYENGIYRDFSPFLNSPWYEIPRGVIEPDDLDNVLVTIGISSSPLAYGTVRMEVQYMALGEAAGNLAALSIEQSMDMKSISYSDLGAALNEFGSEVKLVKLCQKIKSDKHRARIGFEPESCKPEEFKPVHF